MFCEVKYRNGPVSGSSLEAVDSRKQRVLSGCAVYYLMSHGLTDAMCRFDVVGIDKKVIRSGEEILENEKITVIKNAFDCRI